MSMRFSPKPENDFYEFIRTYYRDCRGRFDKIEAVAGKWMYRDLSPAMSDFDSRFIVNNEMTAEDWCRMSSTVGQVHLELSQKYPCWWRNLEHLPGVNLTWTELLDEEGYYPEYQLWTFYDTRYPEKVAAAQQHFSSRPWDLKDEYFHLNRFSTYYGRYDRSIDPAINLGVHEGKYPMHSRLMHYFNPPVHSAVCMLLQKNLPGKMNAFEVAKGLFPQLECWAVVDEILHAHYETPAWYVEPALTRLEDLLEEALAAMAQELRKVITLVPETLGVDVPAWKKALQHAPIHPALLLFERVKFSRLMKGRLYFYTHAPEGFDTLFLIQNELGRIGNNFFVVPYRNFWKIIAGKDVPDPAGVLDELPEQPLNAAQVAATREFARLTLGNWQGQEYEYARRLVDVYDDFYCGLDCITRLISAYLAASPLAGDL